MITLDYTVDAKRAAGDFVEEGSQPLKKKMKTAVDPDIRLYDIQLYYILDMSVLPKNRQLVFSIQNYIWDTSKIFSISSLVKILLTSFLCFSFVFHLVFRNTHI